MSNPRIDGFPPLPNILAKKSKRIYDKCASVEIFGVKRMWTRAELKSNAKAVLKRSYWESLAAYIIVFFISSAVSGLLAWIPIIGAMGSVAISLFLTLPLSVGLYFFYLQARLYQPVMKSIFYPFNEFRYMNIVAAMAWQYLFIFLWSLIPAVGAVIFTVNMLTKSIPYFYGPVFDSSMIVVAILCAVIVIAGFVIVVMKSIAYSMTPFILTDNPKIGYARALKLSIQMTSGQKWNIFVLQLSFLGWVLLTAVTLFVGMLFLAPYIMATYCELYVRLRDNAVRSGLCKPAELNLPAY